MIKLCWIFTVLLSTHVIDQLCATSILQLFLSSVAVFYLTIQCGWKTVVPLALFSGMLLDVSFGCSVYFYTLFLPIVPVLAASSWDRHGDCGNILLQVIPLFMLTSFAAGLRFFVVFQWGNGLSQFIYGFVYLLLSTIVSTAGGIIFIAFLDEIAGYVGIPLFTAVHKNRRR